MVELRGLEPLTPTLPIPATYAPFTAEQRTTAVLTGLGFGIALGTVISTV
ncbi:MAG TPA: hypothetical protein VGR06_06935 [Actinophytocola sp.]|jgi:hypothetical protein|nr:hypothetical protein [Actinophytocola sp.]